MLKKTILPLITCNSAEEKFIVYNPLLLFETTSFTLFANTGDQYLLTRKASTKIDEASTSKATVVILCHLRFVYLKAINCFSYLNQFKESFLPDALFFAVLFCSSYLLYFF